MAVQLQVVHPWLTRQINKIDNTVHNPCLKSSSTTGVLLLTNCTNYVFDNISM